MSDSSLLNRVVYMGVNGLQFSLYFRVAVVFARFVLLIAEKLSNKINKLKKNELKEELKKTQKKTGKQNS